MATQQFIKHNPLPNTDALFKEAQGLALLRNTIPSEELNVPELVSVSNNTLTLALIDACPATHSHYKALGSGLAKLHSIPHARFGLEGSNYIGLNPQPNCISNHWGDFFYQYRLQYQVSIITDKNIKNSFNSLLSTHKQKLIEFLNSSCTSPSLVHGDLWSGNVLFSKSKVWLIDPAVYYADSEVDIAMTEMFGGFAPAFYQAYQSVRPLTAQYEVKKSIFNLYHYLNHYNLFGASYLAGCEQGLSAVEML